jgi:hypothetical protein
MCKITDLSNGGELHEYGSGTKKWYLSDKLHREDGPAIEWGDGSKSWWLNGKRHREDGPAIEYCPAIKFRNGNKEWWLNDKQISQNEFEHLMRLKAFW